MSLLYAGNTNVFTESEVKLQTALDAVHEYCNLMSCICVCYLGITPNFLIDSTGTYLLPLGLQISADSEPAEAAVQRMLDGAPRLAYPPPQSVTPPGCTLEKVSIENGIARIDIANNELATAFMNHDIGVFRQALYLTMKECCSVTDLVLELNGREARSYTQFCDLPESAAVETWNHERDYTPDSAVPDIAGGSTQ